jgi:L-lactate dehydrogenase complex protein LldG
MDREAFLRRVRDGLRGVTGPSLPEDFPRTPASGDGSATTEGFLAALAAAGGSGRRVAAADLPAAVAEAAAQAVTQAVDGTAVLSPDVGPFTDAVREGLASAGLVPTTPAEPSAWRDESARAALGVTSARLGVAATGSVLIVSGAASPRAASVLPPAHLVVLPSDRLVSGLEDVMPILAEVAETSSSPFLVTGPSRTTDIEMTAVIGVHGPRSLHVLLVDQVD